MFLIAVSDFRSITDFLTCRISCLGHPWLAGHHDVKIPLDMIVYKLVKAYVYSSSLRKASLRVCISVLAEFSSKFSQKKDLI